MMPLTAVIVFLWTAGPPDFGGQKDAQVLELAETAFQQGVNARGTPEEAKFFQQAAEHYEELRRRGFHNTALYQNQGSALLLAGDWPGAILSYRRGLRLNPNDRQMRANLAYARDQIVYSSADNFARPPADWWPPWLHRLTPSLTFWLFVAFYSLAWFGLARAWTSLGESLRWVSWLGLAGSFLFASILIIQILDQRAEMRHPVVVIAEDKTYLHKGNNALYPRSYETPLNRGVEARLLEVRGSWLQIELAGGQIGWVPRENALLDIP
jgi:tetratricopeptide (TPR) repeat protein